MHAGEVLERLKAVVSDLRDCDLSELGDLELGGFLRELRTAQDAHELVFSRAACLFSRRGDHLLDGACSAVGWIRNHCKMSAASAADRICVGKELEAMTEVAEALGTGEIGYQSASVICHVREQLGEKGKGVNQEAVLHAAREFGVHDLRKVLRHARHEIDPDAFDRLHEEDFSRRWLRVSSMLDGMFAIDGVLDQAGGAAVRSALDSLNRRLGEDDARTAGQRNADALVELTHHALDQGTLPTRRGVKPHVSLTTSLETLKREVGAPAAEVEFSVPLSATTLERFACDCTMSRVLLQDSMVVDVGRATRIVSGPTGRALKARDRRCRWPGCDISISWTSPHHIVYWTRGGPTKLSNLLSLCYTHHRNVHEGGWQVIAHGQEYKFLPPDPARFKPVRGPAWKRRWAA